MEKRSKNFMQDTCRHFLFEKLVGEGDGVVIEPTNQGFLRFLRRSTTPQSQCLQFEVYLLTSYWWFDNLCKIAKVQNGGFLMVKLWCDGVIAKREKVMLTAISRTFLFTSRIFNDLKCSGKRISSQKCSSFGEKASNVVTICKAMCFEI